MARPKTSKHHHAEQSSSQPPKSKPKKSLPSKLSSSKPSLSSPSPKPTTLSLPQQQNLLNCFTAAFSSRFDEALREDVQRVKGLLWGRDFEGAFAGDGKEGTGTRGLEAYAVRWSAGRGVGYADLFCSLGLFEEGLRGEERGSRERKVLCLGGGAGAEVVALAGWMSWVRGERGVTREDGEGGDEERVQMKVLVVDVAPWSSCLEKLHAALTTPLPLSPYAGAAIKAANRPLVSPEDFSTSFQQRDILKMSGGELEETCEGVGMVTLMFTLNELYTTSISKMTGLLLGLTGVLGEGVVLCVVDSPGSYSVVGLGKGGCARETEGGGEGDGKGEREGEGGKRYPMKWLLDHTLLEAANEGGEEGKKWEKVHEEESRWFRLGEGLKYPIDLEDMRMQVHVYRRL
ncbi:MAG: hypothetical protein Q9184_006111 [Pyrenodesmia sp. 2 TL-2023]